MPKKEKWDEQNKKKGNEQTMDKRTDQLVSMVFDDIPYSPEAAEAQERIGKALDEKYRKLCETSSEGEAMDMVLTEYGQLTKLAGLAGYTEEQALSWRNAGDALEFIMSMSLNNSAPVQQFAAFMRNTGFFCGHDHYNNASIEYKGIRLTYGMSIDYLAMPGIEKETKQRGAELITIHPDSSWDLEQIPLTTIQ